MERITGILEAINHVVWGPGMLVLLIGTGLYLTVGLRFLTFRKIHTGFSNLWKGRSSGSGKGELTPFNALMTALAGTIGTGSIAGVATAIFLGGPGALFWMWCTAMVGMATKFTEVLLAVRFREVTPAGNFVGGAMYFIKNGLGPKWTWLGTLFCVFTVVACFGTGNAVQSNSIAEALAHGFGVPTWITALTLFVLVGGVLLGGLKRIGNVAGRVVPFMACTYIAASLLVLILNITEIPAVFMLVITEAFTPTAAQGGFAGATLMMAIRYGMARGVFSNEAGLGTAPIAHAAAETVSPLNQAMIGMLDTFITTIIVCSMTGFAVLVTGQWTSGITGVTLVATAFEEALPGFGTTLVSISLSLFAFTTILGWCVYGERSVIYLFGDKGLIPFRVLYTCMVPIGAVAHLDVVWILADTVNALMAIPNLTAVLLLSPVVFKIVREYELTERLKKQ
ncbi:MAG: sodium:alanine symporter family protein [Bilophila sp.]